MIAVEGPCFAGKTSAIEELAARLPRDDYTICPDYADIMDSDAPPAPPHSTVSEELEALMYFTKLDKRRLRVALEEKPRRAVFFDRCYHTLLAHVHACAVLFGVEAWDAALAYVIKSRPYVASTTFLLHVSQAQLAHRSSLLPHHTNPLFTDPGYVEEFYRYFDVAYVDEPATLVRVDGNRPLAAIGAEIYGVLHSTMERGRPA